MTYEYAGFLYNIEFGVNGIIIATPVKGQPAVANKFKHRMAAAACYEEDNE